MTDNDSTNETVFGSDTASIVTTYDKESAEAQRAFDLVIDTHEANRRAAESAIYKAAGSTPMARHLASMLSTLAAESDLIVRAREARRTAEAEAVQKRDLALSELDDPFTTYVHGAFAEDQGIYRANTLLENAPFTFTSLRKLADDEGWCDDFEYLALKALKEGALPDDTIEVRTRVPYHAVPSSYGAEAGEEWAEVFQVHAFVRTHDQSGNQHSRYALERYRVGCSTYVKVSDGEG
jgi:hypothetical protein